MRVLEWWGVDAVRWGDTAVKVLGWQGDAKLVAVS